MFTFHWRLKHGHWQTNEALFTQKYYVQTTQMEELSLERATSRILVIKMEGGGSQLYGMSHLGRISGLGIK